MWRRIAKSIFGPSRQTPGIHVDISPSRLDTASNVEGTTARKPWRTVGQTEQRLREANRQSWITSTKGWSEVLGRFSSK